MTTVMRRALLTLLVTLTAAVTLVAAPVAGAQTTSRAVVIVSTGSGVSRNVIEFSGSISGLEALQLAGASPETITYGPMGQAVCKLFGVGDAPVPGSCPGGWVYYRAVGGAGGWSQSSLGASNTTVHDGDVEGWGYGGAPPFSSFCAVAGCAPPPTDPPATAPPATVPSGGGSAGGGSVVGGAPAGVGVTGATATTAPGSDTTDRPGATTTTAANPSTPAGSGGQRAGRTLAAGVPAATSPGSDGGGSPIGVIVAVVIVAALAGGGVLLRRRRSAA